MKPTVTPFREAADTVMPFGPQVGKTLDQIGSTDHGLLYLDDLSGKTIHSTHLRRALDAYLSDPTIAKDVERLVRARR